MYEILCAVTKADIANNNNNTLVLMKRRVGTLGLIRLTFTAVCGFHLYAGGAKLRKGTVCD